VSEAAFAKLVSFVQMVEKWSPAINLISKGSVGSIWPRHVIDSAQLVPLAPPSARLWVDLGSGGGFPGIVVAIVLDDLARGSVIRLIESDGRKAAFLAQAIKALSVPASVIVSRIEEAPAQGADVVSARALAPLSVLLPLAARHMAPGGIALFPKGARAGEELASARLPGGVVVEELASRTDRAAVILRIRGLSHA